MYWFAFDLSIQGDPNVVVPGKGAGPRTVTGLERPIRGVRWLDNGEELSFAQNPEKGFATVHLTGQPYGTSLVVRVAEIDVGMGGMPS